MFATKSSVQNNNDITEMISLFLEGRSLLIFSEQVYDNFFHRIVERNDDEIDNTIINRHLIGRKIGEVVPRSDSRLSLTMRTVIHVKPRDISLPESPEEKEEKLRRLAFFYRAISEKN